MQIVRDLESLRAARRALAGRVALVPTMGALHAGHLSLVLEAKRRADHVVVSIFVNPLQFAPGEDLERYPRQEATDATLLETEGVDLLWAPRPEQVYGEGFATSVSVARLGSVLCGASRPGHFDGVTTVVAKLFGQVGPDVALFGEKDWQQLAIIRRMARDLDMPIEIAGSPIVRDPDGLALSSRNAYLTPLERATAAALPKALGEAAASIAGGRDIAAALEDARHALIAADCRVDYVELRHAGTLDGVVAGEPARLLAAVWIGGTRLIDNVPVTIA